MTVFTPSFVAPAPAVPYPANVYQPHLVTVVDVRDEAPEVRTLKLQFQDAKVAESFSFVTGQFGEYSVFGAGEVTFCIASSPTREGSIECTFRAVGMKCGIGKCRRCNVGPVYVCKDGPVFTAAQLKLLPAEY